MPVGEKVEVLDGRETLDPQARCARDEKNQDEIATEL